MGTSQVAVAADNFMKAYAILEAVLPRSDRSMWHNLTAGMDPLLNAVDRASLTGSIRYELDAP